MASEDKRLSYDEKNGSSASDVEPVEAGHVSSPRRRFAGFKLEVDQEESSFAATKSASNADFDPIPPSRRTWTMGAYVAYWMADAWAVSNWEVGKFPVTCFVCEVRKRDGAETPWCSFFYDLRWA